MAFFRAYWDGVSPMVRLNRRVGYNRDTYLLCGLRDRVMMIPEQVRRKLAQGIGPSFGLVLMVALGYNEQLGATQPFEVALKMRYPALFAVRRE